MKIKKKLLKARKSNKLFGLNGVFFCNCSSNIFLVSISIEKLIHNKIIFYLPVSVSILRDNNLKNNKNINWWPNSLKRITRLSFQHQENLLKQLNRFYFVKSKKHLNFMISVAARCSDVCGEIESPSVAFFRFGIQCEFRISVNVLTLAFFRNSICWSSEI